MQGHSEFYQFATSFWWLIFPVGWGFAGLLRVIFRHHRAEQTLALLKSYADQGKEPPPEVLALLRSEPRPERRRDGSGLLIPAFLFTGLAAAFMVVPMVRGGFERAPGIFVSLMMAGLAAGFFAAFFLRRQNDGAPK
jgi:hypothetical protein